MLAIFAVIIGGIVTGRLLVGWRLAFVQRLITFIIWALLFLLGVEVGSDPAVVGSLATLGAAAFAIFALSVAGSVFAAWLLWRRIRGRAVSADEGGDADEAPVSAWTALKGSLVIVAFFVAGCVAGLFAPFDMTGSRMSAYVLYALMFCVGVTLGNDRTLAERVRRLDPRLALLPVATAVGTLAGAALAAPLLGGWSLTDSLAVGADSATIRFRASSSPTSGDRSWRRSPCCATSCVKSSPCWPHRSWRAGADLWPPCRSAARRPSTPRCPSSRRPPGGPMPWFRSSTAVLSISASRFW